MMCEVGDSMLKFCLLATLVAVAVANDDCVMGDWGRWTEWTKLECGEAPSGAEEPLRGKYQEHMASRRTPSIQEEGRVPCNAGFSGPHPCSNVDQNAWFTLLDLCGGQGADGCGNGNALVGLDVFGWIDPGTGEENALMTTSHGTAFVRMTTDFNSTNPVVLAWMDGEQGGAAATARPITVRGNYAYIASDLAGHGMQILDLTVLPGIVDTYPTFPITKLTPDFVYNGFETAASFALSADPNIIFVLGAQGGASCSGLMALDVSNPVLPTVASCYADDPNMYNARCMQYGGRDDDYNSNGTNIEVCYTFNGTFMIVMDVTDKTNMLRIRRSDYFGKEIIFQGDIDRREVQMVTGDTGDEAANFADQRCRTHLWNVNDLDDPQRNFLYTAEYYAIDHKQYVRYDYVYQANLEGGMRVLRIDQGVNDLFELGYFDVFLDDPQDGQVQFEGVNDVYPFFVNQFDNGHVITSSRDKGLFILQNDIVIMNKMIEERLANSDRYRYREILHAEDPTTCPTTVQVESRFIHLDC